MESKSAWSRWVANGMQLVGYFLLIHSGFATGLCIKGVSDLLIVFWGWRNRLWDVVAVTLIFSVMNFQRLYEVIHWSDLTRYIATHFHPFTF